MLADEEVAAVGEALRELRVDELVDHDPRGDRPAREHVRGSPVETTTSAATQAQAGTARTSSTAVSRARDCRATLVVAKPDLPQPRGQHRSVVTPDPDLRRGPRDLAQHLLLDGPPARELLDRRRVRLRDPVEPVLALGELERGCAHRRPRPSRR